MGTNVECEYIHGSNMCLLKNTLLCFESVENVVHGGCCFALIQVNTEKECNNVVCCVDNVADDFAFFIDIAVL